MTCDGTAVVFGVGEGIGLAVARAFAAHGLHTVLVARNQEKLDEMAAIIEREGGTAMGVSADLREAGTIEDTVARIEDNTGPLRLALYNAGAQYRGDALDTDEDMFEKVWRLGTLAGYATLRAVGRRMSDRGRGTMIVTGASASLRGRPGFSAFSSAKAGLRAATQAIAQELWPKGVHVAHVVVDGIVDMPATRKRFPEEFAVRPADGVISPAAIAEQLVALHRQPRDGWTFELDLRPCSERFAL